MFHKLKDILEHAERMVEMGNACGNLMRKYMLENKDVAGRMILKCVLQKYTMNMRTGLNYLRTELESCFSV
jgi:hypothetical protein